MLIVAHSAIAALTRVRECEINEEEAQRYSDAIKDVAKHYGFGMSEKVRDWINLGLVASGIYGPRMMAYSIRRASERRAASHGLGPVPAPAAAPAAAAESSRPNGHAAAAGLDLTPAFLTAPVNDEIP